MIFLRIIQQVEFYNEKLVFEKHEHMEFKRIVQHPMEVGNIVLRK
jgi:hypothetical protein